MPRVASLRHDRLASNVIPAASLMVAGLVAVAGRPVWEARIELPEPAPVYRVVLDDELTAAIESPPSLHIDIVDTLGRSMPRGDVQSLPQRVTERVALESPLTLAAASDRDARPSACSLEHLPVECTLPRGEADRGGLALTGTAIDGGTQSGAFGGMSGSNGASNDQREFPWRFSVVTTQLPPESANWSKPTLVLHWHSKFAGQAITWQIGRHVAEVTDADRAALASRGGAARPTLQLAWWQPGRFNRSGRLRATSIGSGDWEASVTLDWSTSAAPLEIGSAPPGAVERLSARVQGTSYEGSADETSPRRILPLQPLSPDTWRIEHAWPKTTQAIELTIDARQSLAILDAGIERLEFALIDADGEEQHLILHPSVPTASVPYDKRHDWTELRLLTPLRDLGAPRLDARYRLAMLWFENRGTPPYLIRAGARSLRRAEYPSPSSSARLKDASVTPTAVPLARLEDIKRAGTFEEPQSPKDRKKTANALISMLVAGSAMLLVMLLATVHVLLGRRLSGPAVRS